MQARSGPVLKTSEKTPAEKPAGSNYPPSAHWARLAALRGLESRNWPARKLPEPPEAKPPAKEKLIGGDRTERHAARCNPHEKCTLLKSRNPIVRASKSGQNGTAPRSAGQHGSHRGLHNSVTIITSSGFESSAPRGASQLTAVDDSAGGAAESSLCSLPPLRCCGTQPAGLVRLAIAASREDPQCGPGMHLPSPCRQ